MSIKTPLEEASKLALLFKRAVNQTLSNDPVLAAALINECFDDDQQRKSTVDGNLATAVAAAVHQGGASEALLALHIESAELKAEFASRVMDEATLAEQIAENLLTPSAIRGLKENEANHLAGLCKYKLSH